MLIDCKETALLFWSANHVFQRLLQGYPSNYSILNTTELDAVANINVEV